jgi:hypothetical protein
MIFGIRLKHYQRLLALGDKAKGNFWINRLLLKQSNKRFKTKNIEQLTFTDFVDAERFLEDYDFYNFCSIFVKRKWGQTIYVHNLKSIVEDFGNQKASLKEKYYYIFDPPQYGELAKESIGTEVRKDFVNEFGNWVVLMDLVCKGQLVNYKKVEKWKLEEFLFWANYLSGQKIIENVK